MVPSYRPRGEAITPGAQVIFRYLVDHPLDYRKEIRHGLRMPNGTFQYHLQVLESRGLIRPVRYAGRTYYRILVRGAPRVATLLRDLGWDEAGEGGPLVDVGQKVDRIHLAADRAIIARAARESAALASGVRDHYLALKTLLVM
ncbi:MAG TPA: hypothetical protein VGB42_07385 [Candidatus Thermoplasmatota archaeon]